MGRENLFRFWMPCPPRGRYLGTKPVAQLLFFHYFDRQETSRQGLYFVPILSKDVACSFERLVHHLLNFLVHQQCRLFGIIAWLGNPGGSQERVVPFLS